MSLEWRDLATTIASSLLSKPIVLMAWVAALGVVVAGGSLFVFLIKAARSASWFAVSAGRSDRAPAALPDVAQASAFSVDAFIEGAPRCSRPTRVWVSCLMAIYLASGWASWRSSASDPQRR